MIEFWYLGQIRMVLCVLGPSWRQQSRLVPPDTYIYA